MTKPGPAWSNEPKEAQRTVPQDIDAEMATPTPREVDLEKQAEVAKEVIPQRYDLTSKNTKAARVVHDHNGRSVLVPPGETKQGVLLRPDFAEYLNKGDLTVTASAA